MRQAMVSFTGGRHCVLAMQEARETCAVKLLVTFVPQAAADAEEHGDASKFMAHPLAIIRLQAQAVGLPHEVVVIDKAPWDHCYQVALASLRSRHGVTALITGDVWDQCDGFMHRAVAGTGVELVRPLWQRPIAQLLPSLQMLEMVITCAALGKVPREVAMRIAGRRHEDALRILQEVAMCDQCAGNPSKTHGKHCHIGGCTNHPEFHTMVLDGPMFKRRLALQSVSNRVTESPDGQFVYADLSCKVDSGAAIMVVLADK